MKKSKIINNLHSIIILYLLTGWIFESQRKYLVFFLPSLQFQFLVNNNKCLLTQLENKFLIDEKEEKDKNNESFVEKKFKQFNITISSDIIEYIVNSSVYLSFVISYTLM
tara:strand:+ start:777 stop:1106 length:330 start_codon:yes stop_codon:yes gene_type:complete